MIEDAKLEQTPDRKLSLAVFGMRLEVSPYTLVKQMMNKNSQAIMDELIENGFREVLKEYDEWEKALAEELKKSGEPMDDAIEKYKYSVHVQQIQNVADYSRNILLLHSDSEFFIMEEELSLITESAYSYWKYNNFYKYD